MIFTEVKACQEALVEALHEAREILPFTGAGISTDAGIPDFRSPGSLWTINKPIPFDAFRVSLAVRIEAWRRKFAMDDSYRGAQPTNTHKIIAQFIAEERARAVVTQNIDGLHQASGIEHKKIIELHGNGTYATCLECGHRHELVDIRRVFEASGAPPDCAECGGIVKSATISFGQAMPQSAMTRAMQLATNCDLCLVVGSSLVVYPAASIPLIAREAGARLVIVNREPTGLDNEADLVLRCEIGPLFSCVT